MTDEEEARVREIIEMEVQARMLHAKPEFQNGELEFCDDMKWHYPRAYQRITKEVLKKFNCSIERIDRLKDEQRREN